MPEKERVLVSKGTEKEGEAMKVPDASGKTARTIEAGCEKVHDEWQGAVMR